MYVLSKTNHFQFKIFNFKAQQISVYLQVFVMNAYFYYYSGEPVFSGLRAAKQLLHSAQLNQKRNGFDVYDKTGNVLQAYRDFYALHPKNVKALPRVSASRDITN